jgi:hypothetical protein
MTQTKESHMSLLNIAKRVKRGVRLLDKKIPNWRAVLRKHKDQFNFGNSAHCVLGTLEHFSGQMQTLKARIGLTQHDDAEYASYTNARKALKLRMYEDEDYGFDACHQDERRGAEINTLSDLWRAEFEA